MAETFRAFVAQSTESGAERGVIDIPPEWLGTDGVLIEVLWSSLNYKDVLASSADGGVARISPLIVGIDLAGRVVESPVESLRPGDPVLAHGYEIGVSRHGGLAGLARVPAEWIVPLASGLTPRESMIIGTAGYTAALSVLALREHGVSVEQGPVLVTGATGGVGCMAVSMLAGLGFEVVASTGKAQHAEFLKELGAQEVIGRSDEQSSSRPLLKSKWAGAIDSVGGLTLSEALKSVKPRGVVTSCGNVGGADLHISVLPFILRGITLCGIDSVSTPIDQRRSVWELLSNELKPRHLEEMAHTIDLEGVESALQNLANGGSLGRYLVSTVPM